MFTGLIRETARIINFDGKSFDIEANYKPNIGDSIAINGVCLTVTKLHENGFSVDISEETKNVVSIETMKKHVHLEPAMRLSDRLDGHILQGHIDTIGTVLKIKKYKNSIDFYIKIDAEFMKFIIPKGSIAIDGVSLTINEVFSNSLRLTIIPHTYENTIFKTYKLIQQVNIECDFFAKYLYHMNKKDKQISWDEVNGALANY